MLTEFVLQEFLLLACQAYVDILAEILLAADVAKLAGHIRELRQRLLRLFAYSDVGRNPHRQGVRRAI